MQRKARFSVADHGEAIARALAQRRHWLEALPQSFLTRNSHADAVSRETAADWFTRPVDVGPLETLSKAEVSARLAIVDRRFDALGPRRLRLRVKRYSPHRLTVAVSDGGHPARRLLEHVPARDRPLPALLDDLRAVVAAAKVEALYGVETARGFMREHGDGLLSAEAFNLEAGFNVCVRLPSLPYPAADL